MLGRSSISKRSFAKVRLKANLMACSWPKIMGLAYARKDPIGLLKAVRKAFL